MSDAIQAAKRLTTVGNYNYWEGTYAPNAMEDAEVLAAAYLAAAEQLDAILALARKYAHPGANPGAHGLSSQILRIAGERPTERSE